MQQLPRFKRASGFRALPARDETTIRDHGLPQRAHPPSHDYSQPSCAAAVPLVPHGTQALISPSQPYLALTACPLMTAQSPEPRTAAQRQLVQQQQQQQPHPPLPQLPQRGDFLTFLPGHPVVMDVYVRYPLAASAVAAVA